MRSTLSAIAALAAIAGAQSTTSIDIAAISVPVPTSVFVLPVVYVTEAGAPVQTATTLAKSATASSDAQATNVFNSAADVSVALSSASEQAAATATPISRIKRDLCLQQPLGISYGSVPDTAAAFALDTYYGLKALAAPVPSGWVQSMSNLTASNSADKYMGFTLLQSYDVASCINQCSAISGCNSVNIYFERDPTVNPDNVTCSNPSSTVNIKCVFWGGAVVAANANNFGQWRENFQVLIAGSNAYMKSSYVSQLAAQATATSSSSSAAASATDAAGNIYTIYYSSDSTTGAYSNTQASSSYADCMTACDTDSQCNAFTYVGGSNGVGSGTCWLKSSLGSPSSSGSNVVSGTRSGKASTSVSSTLTSSSSSASSTSIRSLSSSSASLTSSSASSTSTLSTSTSASATSISTTAPSTSLRTSKNASALPPTSDVAWPTMETAREEERKKTQVQEERAPKETSNAPSTKKTEWVNMPYVPTAVFETTLPTRGAPRPTRGGARGGSNLTGRTTYQNGQNGEKPVSKSADASQEQIAAANVEADRESMPPPPKPIKVEESKDTSTNGVSHEGPVTTGAPKRHPSARRNKSPRKFETTGRRQSAASINADALNGTHTEGTKIANKERTFDNPPPFRETKGGKRGRGGHRGGLSNGHFSSQNYANGFPGDFTPAAPSFPPRGGHYPQQSRGGFRGGMRSQSIPFDYGRGQYPGYPMMVPQGYMPDYYGGYMAPVPAYQPGAEQMYLVPAISQQIEYYFSLDNLVKDTFFRKHMDSQGFVFLTFVADFNRLKSLTTDYELLKYVCLNSPNIELRTGQDGKDRLRKAGDWEMWVLPMAERDPSAQNDGPVSFERPPVPHIGMVAPFYPGGMEQFAENAGFEEFRGRQAKSPHRENGLSPLGSYFIPAEDMGGEPDNFPNTQIDNLTVVVRKHEEPPRRAPYHTAGSRTFSDGSIDSKNIYEEVQKTKVQEKKPQTNDSEQQAVTNGDATAAADGPAVTLFWVKDQNSPVDTLPEDTTHEMYSHLRGKALSQREVAATGTCPYDMDVLYQFWSHFLIRNFNSSMYAEFRHLAFADAAQRHNSTGIANLIKYYSEALASQIPIRERVGRHFIELLQSEKVGGERVAFNQLRESWRSTSFNVNNRKKFGDMIDADLKAELEA